MDQKKKTSNIISLFNELVPKCILLQIIQKNFDERQEVSNDVLAQMFANFHSICIKSCPEKQRVLKYFNLVMS